MIRRLSEARIGRTKEVKVLQGNWGYGWDDLAQYDKYDNGECRADLKAYHENDPSARYRVIFRRVPNEDYQESNNSVESMRRNEYFRMSKSNGKRGLYESGVSDYIAQMSTLGYAFNGMIEDTLDFEDRDGEVLRFYGWDEVDDFINDGTLPSDDFDSSWQRYESKNKLHSVESMRRNRRRGLR